MLMNLSQVHVKIEKFFVMILTSSLKELFVLVSLWEPKLLTFMSVVSSGMSVYNLNVQFKRPMTRDSLEETPVDQAMISIVMFMEEQELTFVVRNLL